MLLSKMSPTVSAIVADEEKAERVQVDKTDLPIMDNSKVFASILLTQLAGIIGFTMTLFHFEPKLVEIAKQREIFFWFSYGLGVAAMYVGGFILVFAEARQTWRWILQGGLIVHQSFWLAVFISWFKCEEVLIAMEICTLACLGLSILSFQTKWTKFPTSSDILLVFMMLLLVLDVFIDSSTVIRILYGCSWAFVIDDLLMHFVMGSIRIPYYYTIFALSS